MKLFYKAFSILSLIASIFHLITLVIANLCLDYLLWTNPSMTFRELAISLGYEFWIAWFVCLMNIIIFKVLSTQLWRLSLNGKINKSRNFR